MSTQLGKLSVGSTVYLNVNGGKIEFLIVNQGLPSSDYDDSCNGTWLLMKDLYASRAWNRRSQNSYSASLIHSYLNSTFLNLLDSDIKSAVKTVKLPYTNGTGTTGSVASGSNGLSAQVFLLSYTEVGFSGSSYVNVEGAVLSYFNGAANSKRIAYLNGTATRWWLRSPDTDHDNYAWLVYSSGSGNNSDIAIQRGVRPAMILPSTLIVDDNGLVTSVSVPMGVQGSVTIDGVQKDLTGESYVNINGVWKPIVKSYTCIGSVWKSSNGE